DWYDGLRSFLRLICGRNWLGGWLLPQEHSYFAIALPHRWWLFGVDYSLTDDLDTHQFQYFARIVELYFSKDVSLDKVIILSHLPDWIVNDHENQNYGANLRYLCQHVLQGRIKARLCGDIHNYTRHEPIKSQWRSVSVPKHMNIEDDKKLPQLKSLDHEQSTPDKTYDEVAGDTCGPALIVSGGGGAFCHPTHVPYKKPIDVDGVMYDRVTEYPSIEISKSYAAKNIFGFRRRNLKFDLLGGLMYYLLVFSAFPLCDLNIDSTKENWTVYDGVKKYLAVLGHTILEIVERSYVSVTALFIGWLLSVALVDRTLQFRHRFVIGTAHALLHFLNAVSVLVVMEMTIEAALENKLIGNKTAFDTFAAHFPSIVSVLKSLDEQYTCGWILYLLSGIFSVVDITGFHVSLRKTICDAKVKQIEFLFQKLEFPLALENEWYETLLPSRAHRLLYHITAVLFYWILCTPLAAFVVALYLFVSVNFLGIHFTEAFSSMRMEDFKNFLRCHIDKDGSLSIYAIGVDKVPRRWQQDSEWTGRGTLLQVPLLTTEQGDSQLPSNQVAGRSKPSRPMDNKRKANKWTKLRHKREKDKQMYYNIRDLRGIGPSYTWEKPSRWIPKKGESNIDFDDHIWIIDHIRIP
ncbi:hypothetical protein RFI_05786, partial [Reticulomyxa filosa]